MKHTDLNTFIQHNCNSNDIVMNDIDSIPNELLLQLINCSFYKVDDILKKFFFDNLKYNIIGVHFTRLFDYEIENVKRYGLHSDDTHDYKNKINALPTVFNKYKTHLIEFVANNYNKRSDGKIYFDIGKIAIRDDNEIFTLKWGGETLYCYYDVHNKDKDKQILDSLLFKDTFPCMVILRVNAFQFFTDFPLSYSWLEAIKDNQIKEFSNEHCVNKDYITVVDVIKL